MATLDEFRTARRGPAILTSLIGRLIAWNDRRVTLKMLARLTDYQLSDIGLERADVVSWMRRR